MKKLFLVILLFLIGIAFVLGEAVNEWCPVTPEERIDSTITTVYKGVEIAFCCKRCLREFNADPEAFLKKVIAENSGVPSMHDDGHDHEHQGESNTISTPTPVHDHATDHSSEETSMISEVLLLFGKLHVVFIHFPIALILLAFGFEVIGWKTNNQSWLDAGRLNFICGAVAAIVAAMSGWITAFYGNYYGELAEYLSLHRMLGTISAVAVLCGFLALVAERLQCDWGIYFYRFILVVLMLLIPVTAHMGGTLIYGIGYFSL